MSNIEWYNFTKHGFLGLNKFRLMKLVSMLCQQANFTNATEYYCNATVFPQRDLHLYEKIRS